MPSLSRINCPLKSRTKSFTSWSCRWQHWSLQAISPCTQSCMWMPAVITNTGSVLMHSIRFARRMDWSLTLRTATRQGYPVCLVLCGRARNSSLLKPTSAKRTGINGRNGMPSRMMTCRTLKILQTNGRTFPSWHRRSLMAFSGRGTRCCCRARPRQANPFCRLRWP